MWECEAGPGEAPPTGSRVSNLSNVSVTIQPIVASCCALISADLLEVELLMGNKGNISVYALLLPQISLLCSVCVTRCVSTAEAAKLHQTNLKKKVFPARLSTTVSVTSCVLSYFMFVHYYGPWNDLINIVDVTCLYSQQTTNLRPEHTQCPAPPISLLVVLFCFWLHRELLFSSAVIKVAQTVHWQTDSFSFNVWFNSFGLQLQLQRAEMLRLRCICGRCFIWIQSNHERLSQKQKHTEILIS